MEWVTTIILLYSELVSQFPSDYVEKFQCTQTSNFVISATNKYTEIQKNYIQV